MKKIIALVLALVMVLSLGTVAFAKSGKPETIEYVGEIAANAAARALQIPAFVLGTSMKFNQNAIVGAVNVAGAATYYGTKAAATTLDNAVAIGGGIAQARITVTGGVVAGAINLLHKAVVSLENESRNELLIELDEDLLNARDTVRAGVEVADKAITAVKNAVDNAVDVLFNGELWEIREFFRIKNSKADSEQAFDRLDKLEVKGIEGGAFEPISLHDYLNPNEMTLKEILLPGEWMEYVKYPVTRLFINKEHGVKWGRLTTADLDEDESYLAGWVNKFIERAYTELTDSTNFEEMNGALKYPVDGGEVAEFLFKTVYNLINDNDKWDGYVPSWGGEIPTEVLNDLL